MLNTEMEHGKLEEQGRLLPDRKRQEGREKLYNKDFSVKQFPAPSAERAREYLRQIPADCDYDTWFKAGCALKHEGLPYEVFREWSATAPGKFDENECRRQWENISDEKENLISLGTLKWLARQNGSPLFEILPPPQSMEEMTLQAAQFIDALALHGESLELTLESIQNEKGRLLPLRSKSMLATSPMAENPEICRVLKSAIRSCPHGAWVSLNPIREQIAGKAPGDADVTSFRYTLIEADELTKEEQWEKIRRLNLPVKSVVWSGGKSLHVIVKIEAETDRKLYDARVKALHEYLDRKEFPYDKANKNPSRLTRLPGFYRENDLQYLAAGEFGPKSWEEFEALYLTSEKHDKRKASSPLNGLLGGRPKTPVTEYAEAFLAEYQTPDKLLTLRYWDSTWYLYCADTWITLTTEEMKMRITGFLQRENVQAQERISQSLVNDILVNLQSDHLCGLPASKYRMPCWLPNGENADAWMSFQNGVLNLKSLIENPDSAPEFLPNTPRFFSRHRVAYAFDPAAECPLWQEYLNTTFDSDEMRRAFQMLFGYILSGETRLNAGFFWIGQGGDGKSTGAHILRELVGSDNSCCLPFGNLKDKFSSVLLTENKLNLVQELPVTSEQSGITECEKTFKLVTDGAEIPVERKYQPPGKARATARIVFTANALPQFVDRTNGLWDRLVIFPFPHRFRGTDAQKSDLKHTLETELPGICNWAIQGARMLRNQKRFPIPEESRNMAAQHRIACDHESEFFREWIMESSGGRVDKSALYYAYVNEMRDSGYHPKGRSNFNQALRQAFPDLQEERLRSHGKDLLIWRGIILKEGAKTWSPSIH